MKNWHAGGKTLFRKSNPIDLRGVIMGVAPAYGRGAGEADWVAPTGLETWPLTASSIEMLLL